MNTLYFSETAPSSSDAAAHAKAAKLEYQSIYTSNQMVVTEARVLFKQGVIPKFRIMFEGNEVAMDDDASIPFWPTGFGARLDYLYRELFGL